MLDFRMNDQRIILGVHMYNMDILIHYSSEVFYCYDKGFNFNLYKRLSIPLSLCEVYLSVLIQRTSTSTSFSLSGILTITGAKPSGYSARGSTIDLRMYASSTVI